MKTRILLPSIFILLTSPAYALNDNSAAVSGSQNDVNQITGNGNVLSTGSGAFGSTASTTTTNNATGGTGGSATGGNATGGAGGQGGQGGRGGHGGTGVGVGVGGSSSATGGNQSQAATTGNQSVSISNKRSVASAAPGLLVAADDTCMGSSSAGAQGIGFGVSLGSTWQDDNCVRRKDARELHNMGLQPAAIALMCQDEKVQKAMATAGTPCAEVQEVAVSAGDSAEWIDRSAYPTSGSRNH